MHALWRNIRKEGWESGENRKGVKKYQLGIEGYAGDIGVAALRHPRLNWRKLAARRIWPGGSRKRRWRTKILALICSRRKLASSAAAQRKRSATASRQPRLANRWRMARRKTMAEMLGAGKLKLMHLEKRRKWNLNEETLGPINDIWREEARNLREVLEKLGCDIG